MINATRYEVVNKETQEVHLVTGFMFGNAQEQMTIVMTDIGNIVFDNPGQLGNLTNERYEIREVAPTE